VSLVNSSALLEHMPPALPAIEH